MGIYDGIVSCTKCRFFTNPDCPSWILCQCDNIIFLLLSLVLLLIGVLYFKQVYKYRSKNLNLKRKFIIHIFCLVMCAVEFITTILLIFDTTNSVSVQIIINILATTFYSVASAVLLFKLQNWVEIYQSYHTLEVTEKKWATASIYIQFIISTLSIIIINFILKGNKLYSYIFVIYGIIYTSAFVLVTGALGYYGLKIYQILTTDPRTPEKLVRKVRLTFFGVVILVTLAISFITVILARPDFSNLVHLILFSLIRISLLVICLEHFTKKTKTISARDINEPASPPGSVAN